uniref:FAM65 N-terminal domain-containing protein n=1 Tax=Zonotrichia albicollis TaxID=44394 RepID=A0A8D2N9T8_ZONAL
MSVKLTFVSPGDGGGISRSCSFTGFSTVQSRKLGKSLSRSSVRSRMSLKPPKAYNSLQKGALIWDPKPLQVKKIFEALKKGLNEYLEAHQAELDCLSGRHKDTKRNSRLCLLSPVPKVEELYEAYCIQCRLRDGATNMKQAFSLSPATKASRESLVELYRNVQECTEDMCFIEGALEVHLGEFHVKMKGLVGFARLCPGDQYEVFVRLGRQKWRLRGKIETDDSQTWDEEEKIFIPNLHEKFEIKVTELRGLATILVGVVTCDSSSFFSPKPQAIVVDITELGTIKLRLEVLWNPFDTENLFLSPGSTAKFSVGSRKSSLYNWTPPNTPSFRERYYLSLLQQRQSPGDGGEEAQPPSILSYLAACDFDVPGRNKPHNPAETSEGDSFSSEDQKGAESRSTTPALDHRMLPLVIIQEAGAEELQHPLPDHSTLDILKKTPCGDGFPRSPSAFPPRHKALARFQQLPGNPPAVLCLSCSLLPAVLQRLLEQILTCDGLLPSCHLQAEPVTLFQFYRYLERHRIGSLEKHLAKLAKEGCSRPRVWEGKQRLCRPRLRAVSAISARTGSWAAQANSAFFQQAVESIEQVAHLCQSETEEVRNAARETTLSFGERGRQAFEKMDRICCELRETAQEAEIEITVF